MKERDILNSIIIMAIASQICRENMEAIPSRNDPNFGAWGKYKNAGFVNLMKKNEKEFTRVIEQVCNDLCDANSDMYISVLSGVENLVKEYADAACNEIMTRLSGK